MNAIDELKNHFKEDMLCIFHDKPMHKVQLRDVWRVYFMGAVAMGMMHDEREKVEQLMTEAQVEFMHDPNWWPDNSFAWWV